MKIRTKIQSNSWVRTVAVALAALLIATLPVVIYRLATKPPAPFDPLVFPTQQVTDTVPGYAGPAVHLGADVHVTATKCNTADRVVTVQSRSDWSTVGPLSGSVVPRTTGVAGSYAAATDKGPFCKTTTFANPMPSDVVTRTEALFAEGITDVDWIVTGFEVPTAPHGVGERWATVPFRIVP